MAKKGHSASPDAESKQIKTEKGPHHSVFSLFHLLLGLPGSADRGQTGNKVHFNQFSRNRTEPGEIGRAKGGQSEISGNSVAQV